jgi:hypothetical protein
VIIFDVLTFGFAWWLGLYLLARDPRKALLRRSGLGLVAYALALAYDLLASGAPTIGLAMTLTRLHWALIFFPALLWSGALIQLLPESLAFRDRIDRWWAYGVVPAGVLGALAGAGGGLIFAGPASAPRVGPVYLAVVLLPLLPLAAALVLVARFRRTIRPRGQVGLLLVATLFFGLGTALLVFPLGWLDHTARLLAIGIDLALVDLAIAGLDAFDEGETLRPDIIHSFAAAGCTALLFGVMVALTIAFGTGATFPMRALLFSTVAVAIALPTFAEPLAAALDRLVFAAAPRLRQARADLRGVASALPRVNAELTLAGMDEAEFARLTRRALSHYGDLPRLSSSPLTRLPLIDARLARRGAPDDPLERAVELKTLLAESIARLKPRAPTDFGTADEWRYYNALFFPYVAGLKPYSQRADHRELDPATRQALDWFRAVVPERTLHNWQNAAAKLVAQDLRQQMGRERCMKRET